VQLVAPKPAPKIRRSPKPGSLEHFRRWAFGLTLDTMDPWEVETFQRDIVADILGGIPEVWAVIPEGNGKTTLLGGVALYHARFVPAAFVPIAAASRERNQLEATTVKTNAGGADIRSV
jgi:phage terminase large subunit-like protein